MPRNHHLRERRLKLGLTQFELGCLANWPPRSAQTMVSHIELDKLFAVGRPSVNRLRAALVYMESEPRREREWKRQDYKEQRRTEEAIMLGLPGPVIERMVDLLWDGRCEEYDALAALVPCSWARRAADRYLDESTPCF